MVSYLIDVDPIVDEIGASVHVTGELDMDALHVGDETFTMREPARFDVAVSNAGGGIVAYGSISAQVRTTCSRCLCEFDDVLEGEVVGFYLRPGDEMPQEDEAEHVTAEGKIDIGPALTAALVIEAPFAPLHDPGCAGLCTVCGADLNVEGCTCAEAPEDEHPFAGLRSLLDSGEGETPEP